MCMALGAAYAKCVKCTVGEPERSAVRDGTHQADSNLHWIQCNFAGVSGHLIGAGGKTMATKKATQKAAKKAPAKKTAGKKTARKYSPSTSKNVEREMKAMKEGKLKSGRSGKKVTNPKQAIAIGLSEARKEGKKVPPAK